MEEIEKFRDQNHFSGKALQVFLFVLENFLVKNLFLHPLSKKGICFIFQKSEYSQCDFFSKGVFD